MYIMQIVGGASWFALAPREQWKGCVPHIQLRQQNGGGVMITDISTDSVGESQSLLNGQIKGSEYNKACAI